MSSKSYTLQADQKASQVILGTADTLIWGDLILKAHLNASAFLNTLAEDFVPIHDARILFLTPTEQVPPVERPVLYVRLDEILLLFSPAEVDAPPEESETLHYEPVEIVVGSFLVEGMFMKSPQADLHNLLLVSNVPYMDFYRATIRHVAKLWLGTFSANRVQIRRDRLSLAPQS
jgi:hypothetical protein